MDITNTYQHIDTPIKQISSHRKCLINYKYEIKSKFIAVWYNQ